MEFFTKLGICFLSELMVKSVEYALRKSDKTTLESLQNVVPLLCAKAYDVNDAIKKAELSGRKKRKREVQEWLEQVQAIDGEFQTFLNEMQMEGFIGKFFVGGEAVKLNARVHELVEQTKDFGELVVDDGNLKGEEFLTKGLVGKEFDDNLKKIWNFFVTEKVSSIGIYGMGGAGKTTLAKHINNQLIKQSQDHVVWITVSQEFSICILQDKMAKELGLDLSAEYDEDKRATRLNRALSMKKKLVLIFDDVWNEFDLMKLGDPLSIDECRLLITTRSKAVCHKLQCKQLIKVNKLMKDEAWELFIETVGQATNLTGEMQNIAESMVEECDGLPLGIITLAGSMRGESSINVWRDALEKLREQDLEESVFKVLKHSFDWLGQCEGKSDEYSESQLCFLYCSLYPEDQLIYRETLITKFILEGFLSKRKSRRAMFVRGHAILDKLVNACMLERDSIHGVKMHDMMRDMAVKITKGVHYHCLSHGILSEEELGEDIKRMYLSMSITEIPSEMSMNFPKLVTMLVDGGLFLEFIPDSFFLQMCSLSILDLSGTKIKKLPHSLSGLANCKALLLQWCSDLESVPDLGNLKKLQELDLSGTPIERLPQGIGELSDLRFLSLYSCTNLKMLPENLLLKFPYLQCFLLPEHIEAPIEEMEKLKHLEEFRGKVNNASKFHRLISSWPDLSYNIVVGPMNVDFPVPLYEHMGYNQLTFTKYDLKDVIVLAKGIQHLYLDGCKGLGDCLVESLAQLNINPSSIETMRVKLCEEIECLWRIDRGGVTSTSASPPLPLPPPPPPALFSSVSVLNVYRCGNMKKLGLLASHLINLTELWIWHCEMIQDIVEMSEEDIGREASTVAVSLPKLVSLSLLNLPRLKSICNAKLVCSSINWIELKGCKALEKLPLVSGQLLNYDSPPPRLRHINIRKSEKEWWEKLQLGHTTHHSLLQPFICYDDLSESGRP